MSPRAWLTAAGGTQVVALAFGAGTNLLYARLLTASEIGQFAVLISTGTLLVLFADLGLQLLVTRGVAIGELRLGDGVGLLLCTPVVILGAWGILVGLNETLRLSQLVGLHESHMLLLLELAMTLWLFQITLTLLQAVGRYNRRSATLLVNGILTAGCTAIVLVVAPAVSPAVHATAVAYVAAATLGIGPLLLRERVRLPSVENTIGHVRSAAPLWSNGLLGAFTTTADVLLAAAVLPLASVGQYQILKRLSAAALAPLATLLPLLYAHFCRVPPGVRSLVYQRGQLATSAGLAIGMLLLAPCLPPLLSATVGRQFVDLADVLVLLFVGGTLQFQHNLLGYLCTSAQLYSRPLVINAVVAGAGAAASMGIGLMLGLRGFVIGLLAANLLGVGVALRMASPLLRSGTPKQATLITLGVTAVALSAMLLTHMQVLIAIAAGVGSAALLIAVTARPLHFAWTALERDNGVAAGAR